MSLAHNANDDPRQAQREAEIERCLYDMDSGNPRVRAEAAQRLGQLRAGHDALVVALEEDHNSFVRAATATALGQQPASSEAIDALLAAIDDNNDHVAAAAIHSLGLLRADAARDEILSCLSDPHPRVVQAAIVALGRLGPPSVAEHLVVFLDDTDTRLRGAASQATSTLNYTPAGPAILRSLELLLEGGDHADLRVAKQHLDALARLQVRAALPLLLDVARRRVGLRSAAVQALTSLDAAAAAPELVPMFADPSARLREALIHLMRAADYREALPQVRQLLRAGQPSVRLAALALVTDWGDAGAAAQVRAICFGEANPYLRPAAVRSLAALLGTGAVGDLLRLADDRNPHVRQTVALSLGSVGRLPPHALATLGRLALDEQPQVAQAAQGVLADLELSPARLPDSDALAEIEVERPVSPLPASVAVDAAGLAALLERWQAELPETYGCCPPSEVAEIDAALSVLLAALKRAGR